MKTKKRRKTHLKYWLIVGAVVIILFIKLGSLFINTIGAYTINLKYQNEDGQIGIIAQIIDKTVQETIFSLTNNSSYLSTYEEANKETVLTYLKDSKEKLEVKNMIVADKNGNACNLQGEELNISNQQYFTEALSGKIGVGEFQGTIDTSEYNLYYYAPIKNESGVQGVLVYVTNVMETIQKYSPIQFIESEKLFFVMDQEKNILSRGTNEEVHLSQAQILQIESISKQEEIAFLIHEDKEYKITSEMGYYDTKLIEDGKVVQWYTVELPTNNWTILIGQRLYYGEDTSRLLNKAESLILMMAIAFFILLICVIYIEAYSSHKVFRITHYDQVTGFYNVNRFYTIAMKILKRVKTGKFAIVTFDMDKFKIINDIYGYQKGDSLLKEIATTVAQWKQKNEVFSRVDADQFVILIHYETTEEFEKRIEELNQKLCNILELRVLYFSFGVYLVKDLSISIERMCNFSAFALECIKGSPDHMIHFFEDKNYADILREKQLEQGMEDAIAKKEFIVYLQPKYIAKTKKVIGAEALVRWISEDKGFINPGEFIPLFERNGFITKLDSYMLSEVCKIQRNWIDSGCEPVTISVNISRNNLNDPTLVYRIREIVDRFDIPHQLIEIELTESAFFDNKQVLIETVNKLKEFGFAISMDDFGSGYSSLNSLKDLSLDIIKLDRGFFNDLTMQPRSQTIIKDTVCMAKNLEMKIVAEGIETKDQVEFLDDIGCDYIQGFYFAKPMPVNEFTEVMKTN